MLESLPLEILLAIFVYSEFSSILALSRSSKTLFNAWDSNLLTIYEACVRDTDQFGAIKIARLRRAIHPKNPARLDSIIMAADLIECYRAFQLVSQVWSEHINIVARRHSFEYWELPSQREIHWFQRAFSNLWALALTPMDEVEAQIRDCTLPEFQEIHAAWYFYRLKRYRLGRDCPLLGSRDSTVKDMLEPLCSGGAIDELLEEIHGQLCKSSRNYSFGRLPTDIKLRDFPSLDEQQRTTEWCHKSW